MSDLRRQDTCSAYSPERNGVTMAFLNVGHGSNWAYNPEGLERPPFHFRSHRLLYQVGRSSIVCQYNKVSGSLIHKERNHMSIWASGENHIRQWA